MIDIYLQELMHGNVKKQNHSTDKNDGFTNEIDKEIDKEIDEILLLEQDASNELEKPLAHKERVKLEMKKELELPEIAIRIKSALDLLYETTELDPLEKENILTDLSTGREIIDELSGKFEIKDNIKELLEISDESIESIFKLALNKLDANELENSLALFTLLVVLIPESADYCYRAGIIAQMCENTEFALKLFSACLINNPEIIEAKILSLDCYIKLGNNIKALELCNELNQLITSNVVDNKLIGLFIRLKTNLGE